MKPLITNCFIITPAIGAVFEFSVWKYQNSAHFADNGGIGCVLHCANVRIARMTGMNFLKVPYFFVFITVVFQPWWRISFPSRAKMDASPMWAAWSAIRSMFEMILLMLE